MVVCKDVPIVRDDDSGTQPTFAAITRPHIALTAEELAEKRIRQHGVVALLLFGRLDNSGGTDLDNGRRGLLDHVRERIRQSVETLRARTRICPGRSRN